MSSCVSVNVSLRSISIVRSPLSNTSGPHSLLVHPSKRSKAKNLKFKRTKIHQMMCDIYICINKSIKNTEHKSKTK